MGKRRKFSPEYREEAAKMVIETSRPIAHVAREFGVGEQTLDNWVKEYRNKHADEDPPPGVSERARLHEAERKMRELQRENEFLQKCAAYFTREQR